MSVNTTTYRDDDSERFKATLNAYHVSYLKSISKNTWSKGNAVYEALLMANSWLTDDLSSIEEMIFDQVSDAVSPTLSENLLKNNILRSESSAVQSLKSECEYHDPDEKMRTNLYLPAETLETIRDEKGQRGVSQCIRDSLEIVYRSVYNTRFERLEVIKQFLKLVDGNTITDPHPHIEDVRNNNDTIYTIQLSEHIHTEPEQPIWEEKLVWSMTSLKRNQEEHIKQTPSERIPALEKALEYVDKKTDTMYLCTEDIITHTEEVFNCSRPSAERYISSINPEILDSLDAGGDNNWSDKKKQNYYDKYVLYKPPKYTNKEYTT